MKNGFTLIELLTVIVLLGVIAAITVPIIVDTINDSRYDSCEENVRTIEAAAKRWHAHNPNKVNNDYSLSFDKLRFEDNACLNVIKKALNGTDLKNSINYYYTIHILNAIEKDLESSNITSFNPLFILFIPLNALLKIPSVDFNVLRLSASFFTSFREVCKLSALRFTSLRLSVYNICPFATLLHLLSLKLI